LPVTVNKRLRIGRKYRILRVVLPPPVAGGHLTRPKAGCAMLGRKQRLWRLGKSMAVLEPVAIVQ
jgi:hypothetical protein